MNACGEFIISICSQIDLCILIYADTYARLCIRVVQQGGFQKLFPFIDFKWSTSYDKQI